jgi:hypothetical protein
MWLCSEKKVVIPGGPWLTMHRQIHFIGPSCTRVVVHDHTIWEGTDAQAGNLCPSRKDSRGVLSGFNQPALRTGPASPVRRLRSLGLDRLWHSVQASRASSSRGKPGLSLIEVEWGRFLAASSVAY